jgi:hypothetical protein
VFSGSFIPHAADGSLACKKALKTKKRKSRLSGAFRKSVLPKEPLLMAGVANASAYRQRSEQCIHHERNFS